MRNRVSILLSFAVRRDYRASNPCARLEQVTLPAKTPQILTPQELAICSRWFASNPRALARIFHTPERRVRARGLQER